jgi:hypothetical protein
MIIFTICKTRSLPKSVHSAVDQVAIFDPRWKPQDGRSAGSLRDPLWQGEGPSKTPPNAV